MNTPVLVKVLVHLRELEMALHPPMKDQFMLVRAEQLEILGAWQKQNMRAVTE